jgi:hypothetical protein
MKKQVDGNAPLHQAHEGRWFWGGAIIIAIIIVVVLLS